MNREEMLEAILDAFPYPIVFADTNHVIQYVNKFGRYHYYKDRGYPELVGRSLFDCHMYDTSREKIIECTKKLENHAMDIYLGITARNLRIYMNPVRDADGKLIGYFERFELNLQKA
jgi:DUF438 domain-containing protein